MSDAEIHTAAAGNADGGSVLTPRERECLRLLADGESSKRVAFLLRISTKTAEHHVASARAKLGARNSVHAVAIAVRRGLVGEDG